MNSCWVFCAIVAALFLSASCSNRVTPTAPDQPPPSTPTARVPPLPPIPESDFPPVPQSARIYLFASGLSSTVREWTDGSRYVLYEDGTFALQYLRSRGAFEYRGTYTEANAVFTFHWEANQNVSAPWRPATGTVTGDALTVRYDAIMILDDFENAIYIQTQ
jgi:hypothetical protein